MLVLEEFLALLPYRNSSLLNLFCAVLLATVLSQHYTARLYYIPVTVDPPDLFYCILLAAVYDFLPSAFTLILMLSLTLFHPFSLRLSLYRSAFAHFFAAVFVHTTLRHQKLQQLSASTSFPQTGCNPLRADKFSPAPLRRQATRSSNISGQKAESFRIALQVRAPSHIYNPLSSTFVFHSPILLGSVQVL